MELTFCLQILLQCDNLLSNNIYKLGNFKQAIKDYNIGKVSKVIFENY